jgi:predicted transcriptional regulator
MTNLIIEVPDDLARSLEGIAAAQNKSIQQLAVERLRSLVESSLEPRAGSAAAVLRAMREPPHLSDSDVDKLDAAIAGRLLPVRTRDLFPD